LWERASRPARVARRMAGRVRGDSFLTRLHATRVRRFPLTALAMRARALPQGESGESVVALKPDMRLRCRDASQHPGFDFLAPHVRGWRAEKRKPMVSAILLRPRRAPSGAPQAASCQHRAPLSVAGYGRSVSQLLAGTPNGPGGSPGAARVPCCARPAGAAPRPATTNASRQRPLSGRGGCMISEV
jgi:hypothetical protein